MTATASTITIRIRAPSPWPVPVLDAGPFVFDGSLGETLLIPHAPAHATAAGTLTVLVKVNDLSRLQGIVAKDEAGTREAGHLHLWFAPTGWRARFQGAAGENYVLESPTGINRAWHHLAITFGAAGFSSHLDRHEVGRHTAVRHGLDRNSLSWIIGADAQRRVADTETQGLVGHLTGTVGWVRLYPEQLTAAQIAELADAELAAFFGPDERWSDGTYFSDGTGWRS